LVGNQEATKMPDIDQPSIDDIADQAEIGTVREPEFRLIADLIRMTILGYEQRAAA
jgi:hypothetical protein